MVDGGWWIVDSNIYLLLQVLIQRQLARQVTGVVVCTLSMLYHCT